MVVFGRLAGRLPYVVKNFGNEQFAQEFTPNYFMPAMDIGIIDVYHVIPLSSVKRRKLKRYGHVTRSSGLAKTVLQGTVQGGRRRGRQRKRWEDNIKEWTGLE